MSEPASIGSTLRSRARWLRTRFRRARHQLVPRAAQNVRLHLGCGPDYWKGYVNVDVDPAANSDLCIDMTEIGAAVRDGSVSEVVMIHSLSYLRLWEARDLFSTLVRLLQPGGRLTLELPDLAKCARRALDSDGDLDAYLEGVRGLYAFDMGEIARRRPFTPYAFGWSAWHLTRELEQAGFRDVIIRDPETHERRVWRDIRIEAIK